MNMYQHIRVRHVFVVSALAIPFWEGAQQAQENVFAPVELTAKGGKEISVQRREDVEAALQNLSQWHLSVKLGQSDSRMHLEVQSSL